MKNNKIDLENKYAGFLKTETTAPSQTFTDFVMQAVLTDLKLSAPISLFKMLFIHIVVGSLTLFMCPQFGFGVSSAFSIMSLLMRFADRVCMFGCGLFFLGASGFAISLILKPSEILFIRRTEFFQFSWLAILSVGIFASMSGGIEILISVSWVIGGITGTVIFSRLGIALRDFFRRGSYAN